MTWHLASLESSFHHAVDSIATGPVTPTLARGETLAHLATNYPFDEAVAIDRIVQDVERLLRDGLLHAMHPRYFGLFNPRVRFSGVVADLLAAAYNPQAGAWFHGPAAVELEEHTLSFFATRFGLPRDAAAHFTSGGCEANFTAVVASLTDAFPAIRDKGLRALDAQPVLFVSREAHHSFEKSARMTGLGADAVRLVDTDERDRMSVEALERAIAEARARGERPFLVVGTGGTTSTGAIDPLPEIAEVCARERVWFHADAAWGGAAAVSDRLRPHLAGIERADSITCDAHKWLSVPMGAGMFFTRHGAALRNAFATETPYVPPNPADGPDYYQQSAQWSRRAIGLKLFFALAELGAAGLAKQIERHAELAGVLRAKLVDRGFVVANDSPLAVVCFTPRDGASADEIRRVASSIAARGQAWISPLVRENRPPLLRACITNYATTEADLDVLVSEVERAGTGRE